MVITGDVDEIDAPDSEGREAFFASNAGRRSLRGTIPAVHAAVSSNCHGRPEPNRNTLEFGLEQVGIRG
jgi:hypothetical protein